MRTLLSIGLIAWTLVAGCAGLDTTPRWRCFFNDGLCGCYFASDQDIDDMGYSPESFSLDECPDVEYLCCERGPSVTGYELPACECPNVGSFIGCSGRYAEVPSCP